MLGMIAPALPEGGASVDPRGLLRLGVGRLTAQVLRHLDEAASGDQLRHHGDMSLPHRQCAAQLQFGFQWDKMLRTCGGWFLGLTGHLDHPVLLGNHQCHRDPSLLLENRLNLMRSRGTLSICRTSVHPAVSMIWWAAGTLNCPMYLHQGRHGGNCAVGGREHEPSDVSVLGPRYDHNAHSPCPGCGC